MKVFNASISFIIKQRLSVILIIACLSLFSLWHILYSLSVDNSLSIWFLEDNPDYKEYLQFQEEQGSDEIIIALFPVENALEEDNIEFLNKLHKSIDTLSYVNGTFSLANAKYPVYVNRKINYQPIYNAQRSEKGLNSLLDKMPTIKQQLLTDDTKNLVFYIQLKPASVIASIRSEAVAHIQAVIDSKTTGKYVISGAPILNEAYNKTIASETVFFAVVTVLVILLILLFLLPKLGYIAIAILAIVIPITLLFGFISFLGFKLNMISMLIPTVLMVYSVSDAIHIINIYSKSRLRHQGISKTAQIQMALKESLKPCFYTTLTTMIGYLALCLSPLPALRTMGFFTTVGLLVSFVLVYVITVIGFSFMKQEKIIKKHQFLFLKKLNVQSQLIKINNFTSHYSKSILIVTSVIIVAGLYAMTKIEVNTDSLNLLSEGKEKNDLMLIESALHGSTRLQLTIESTSGTSLFTDVVVDKLKLFHEKLDKNDLVSSPVSLLNIKSFLEKRNPLSFGANTNNIQMDSLLLKSKNDSNSFFSLFSDDLSSLGISVNIKELKTKELETLLFNLEQGFYAIFEKETYQLNIQGFSAVYAKLNQFILQTQFRSFTAAFILSFLVLFIFIGKLKTSVLALIPNLLPLLILAIVMAVFKIPLEVSTVMIAPILLGMVMDDTLHLIYNYKRDNGEKEVMKRMDSATLYTGNALLSTTIALVFGFLVIGTSGVTSISNFGLLCAFAIASALVADLIFLPALFKTFDK